MRKSFLMESFYKKTLGCLILAFLLLLPLAKADSWWNTSWQYRKAITIDNTANSNTLTDYQVLVTLDTTSLISDGKMRTDCGDIRLTYYNSTDDSEKEIPQWVWTNQTDYSSLSYSWWIFGCNTPSTRITVKVPYIPANSYSTIYIYYGNSQAISTSSLLNVYDDNIATMSATLPSSRTALSCAPYGDSIYCFGGIDNSGYLNQIIRYDVISDSITVMSSTLPSGRLGLSCAPYGDSIYCFGGNWLNEIIRYDITSDSITVMSSTLPSGRLGLSCAPYGDSIYCFGGRDNNPGSWLNEIIRYDITSDSITVMSSTLPSGREGLSCSPYGDSIYCFGGDNSTGGYLNEIIRYDVISDSITVMSSTLPSGREGLSCSPYGDSIYCFGGDNSTGGYLNEIIRYDVISDSITVMSSTLPSGRTALSCAPYGDSIYCFGGSFLNQIVRYAKKYTPPDPTYSIGVEETPPPTTTTTTTTTTTLPPVHGVPLLSSTLVGVVIGFGIITFMLRMLFDIREPKKVIEYFIVLAVIVLTVLSLIALFA